MNDKRKCPVCGAEFALVPSMKPRKFCSNKCTVRHHQAIAKAQRPTFVKKCAICGAEFETRRMDSRCCSSACTREYKKVWRKLMREGKVEVKSPQSDVVKDRAVFIEHTYAAIKRKRRARPAVVGGWRGQPVMGGGSAARSNWEAAQ